jgi:hypothetical protein
MRPSGDVRKGATIGATELPPPPAGPSDPSADPSAHPSVQPSKVPLKPSYARLAYAGVIGAIGASGLAVLLALQLAKPDIPAEAFVGAPGPSEAPAPPAVEGLRAEQGRWTADPDSWRISLSWQPVQEAAAYLISRNGHRLHRAEEAAFVDDTVTPEGRYRYEVVAVDVDGARSTKAFVRVRTRSLPPAAARVQGRWILRLTVESSSIYTAGGRILATFTPQCRQGPCDVRWRFEEVKNTGTARNRGASYEGSGFGGFLTLDCHGGVVSSTVTLEFRVRKAHTVAKAWRATEISGTVTESVPSVSNCLSARNVWSFTGSAQG